MFAAIARALPPDDARRALLDDAAAAHERAALDALATQGYAGGHWLGTFALYLRLGSDV
jgi:transposase